MTAVTTALPRNHAVRTAVHRHGRLSTKGLLERAFTFAFRSLVYAQIWEDPEADMEALAITSDCHVVAIASGGCNVMSYLVGDPARITAVDLNPAHIALNRMKRAAAQHLPDHQTLHRFFAGADARENVQAYRQYIRPHLDAETRRYWDRRAPFARRVSHFGKGFYRRGLLGRFIGLAHGLARLHGIDPKRILAARSIEEQRRIFDTELAPLFDSRVIRWLAEQPVALFGLGVPPAQYGELTGGRAMADVLRERLERLACDFAFKDNYFAWQAFARRYGEGADAPLPPYLQRRHHAAIAERAGRIDVRHSNFTDFCASQADASLDRFVLLDAQDWMTDTQLTELWTEITRAARPGARILYRTAGEVDIVPGRVPAAILARWHYQEAESRRLATIDRSAVYGATHLYILGEAA